MNNTNKRDMLKVEVGESVLDSSSTFLLHAKDKKWVHAVRKVKMDVV